MDNGALTSFWVINTFTCNWFLGEKVWVPWKYVTPHKDLWFFLNFMPALHHLLVLPNRLTECTFGAQRGFWDPERRMWVDSPTRTCMRSDRRQICNATRISNFYWHHLNSESVVDKGSHDQKIGRKRSLLCLLVLDWFATFWSQVISLTYLWPCCTELHFENVPLLNWKKQQQKKQQLLHILLLKKLKPICGHLS